MTISIELAISIAIQIVSLGVVWGTMKTRLDMTVQRLDKIEGKVDKHNNFVERLATLEERDKSTNKRLEALEEKV